MPKYKYHLFVFCAAVLWGTVALFSGLLTRERVDVFNQILYRGLFGFLISFIIAKFLLKQDLSLKRKELPHILWNSFFTFGGWTFFMISIFVGTPIAKATILMYTYPIYTVILSYFFLKESPSFKNLIGIILSIISVCILLEIWNIKSLFQIQAGDMFALIDAIFTALVIVYGRRIKTNIKINSFKLFNYTLLFMIPQLFIFGFLLHLAHIDIINPVIRFSMNPRAWIYAISLGAFGTAFTFPLLYIGLSKVKTSIASILLLFEVVAAYIFGVLFFGQQFSLWGIIGMLGIIISTLFI